MYNENQFLFEEIKKGNKEAFTLIFQKYYKDLVLFGGSFLQDKERSEDIVQSVFLRLWENRSKIEIKTSLKSFLLQSVRNGCLDELRHNKIIRDHISYSEYVNPEFDFNTDHYILYSELQSILDSALDKLPSEIKTVFEMNRFDGLKYKEIATKLSVSERTIEVRIGKAITLLRRHFKELSFIIVNYFAYNI